MPQFLSTKDHACHTYKICLLSLGFANNLSWDFHNVQTLCHHKNRILNTILITQCFSNNGQCHSKASNLKCRNLSMSNLLLKQKSGLSCNEQLLWCQSFYVWLRPLGCCFSYLALCPRRASYLKLYIQTENTADKKSGFSIS